MYFVDTHVVIWLYEGAIHKFNEKIQKILEENDIFISPFVKLELQYLYESKRAKPRPDQLIESLNQQIGIVIHSVSLIPLIEKAIEENWTRDPFDRLITAHSRLEKEFLITKDESILNNYQKAIW